MNRKGNALILSLIVLAASLAMAGGLSGIVLSQGRNELRQTQGVELLAAAEGGLEELKWRVKNAVPGWIYGIAQHPVGNCLVTVTVGSCGPDNYYPVTSVARFPGGNPLSRKVSIKIFPPGAGATFAQWMFFVNNAHLTIGTGAEVWGKIHSNKNIMIYGPGTIFHDYVEASGKIIYYNGGAESNTVYYDAHAEGVDEIPMPAASDMLTLKNFAVAGGHYVAGNLTVQFVDPNPGNPDPGQPGRVILNGVTYNLPPPPYNPPNPEGNQGIVIYADGDINVSGTLKGQVTLVSGGTINITGNLKYKYVVDGTVPDTSSASFTGPDVLGLVAEKDVYIPKAAPNDLEIDAAMLARTGKAWADLSKIKGTLKVRGSLASDSLSYFANTNNKGYLDRKYYYDDYLPSCPPPHYLPAGSVAAIKDWQDLGESH